MRLFNNILGIHITDDQITISDSSNNITIGPFCSIKETENNDGIKRYSLHYPFRGSVVADFSSCVKILNEYLQNILPFVHLKTIAYISVSPISGETELRAISDIRRIHKKYLILEPIAFLFGIKRFDGIVVAIHKTMIEISIVKNLKITLYRWKYFYEGIDQNLYDNTLNLLSSISNNIDNSELDEIFLIADNTIHTHLLAPFLQNSMFKYFPDANIIIANNVKNAPMCGLPVKEK